MELEFLRKVDELGRVVLPLEMRKALGIDTGATVKVVCTPEGITLTPVKE